MDVKFINAFTKSITNVLKTMMELDVKFGKPHIKQADAEKLDVSAVIGLSGDASGVVVIAFRKEIAARAASRFAGLEMTVDHADFADSLGEFANMVAGGAKAEFHGLDVSISLPSVIVGDNHEVIKSKVHPALVIPCTAEFGSFVVEICMEVRKPATVGA